MKPFSSFALPSFLGLPDAENFAFSFNTLLSDIAVNIESYRQAIFDAQQETLLNLVAVVDEVQAQSAPLEHTTRCKQMLYSFRPNQEEIIGTAHVDLAIHKNGPFGYHADLSKMQTQSQQT